MWVRPIYATIYALMLPVLVVGSYLGGWFLRTATTPTPTPRLDSISASSTSSQVQRHFNLGTNAAGMQMFTDTSCIPRPKYDVCAWDYAPANHKWAVTLFLREPKGSTAHNPPIRDN